MTTANDATWRRTFRRTHRWCKRAQREAVRAMERIEPFSDVHRAYSLAATRHAVNACGTDQAIRTIPKPFEDFSSHDDAITWWGSLSREERERRINEWLSHPETRPYALYGCWLNLRLFWELFEVLICQCEVALNELNGP